MESPRGSDNEEDFAEEFAECFANVFTEKVGGRLPNVADVIGQQFAQTFNDSLLENVAGYLNPPSPPEEVPEVEGSWAGEQRNMRKKAEREAALTPEFNKEEEARKKKEREKKKKKKNSFFYMRV